MPRALAELGGRPCFIGLDLASKIDIAGNVLVFPPVADDPLWHVHGRYYLPDVRVIEELDGNTDRYREFDALGLLNQQAAAACNRVTLMAAGLALALK